MELLLFVLAIVGIGLLVLLYQIYTVIYNFYVDLRREDTLFNFSRFVLALEKFTSELRKESSRRDEELRLRREENVLRTKK